MRRRCDSLTRYGVDQSSSRLEVLLGRSLAFCAHPLAAWRSPDVSVRMVIVTGYVAAGYVTAFMALALLT